MKFGTPPLTPLFLCTLLRFCSVGIPFPSLTVSAELSKPFAKYLSVSITCVLSGNTPVGNLMTSFSFCIRKSLGRGHSSRSFQVFGLVLPTSTSLGLPPIARLQLYPPPHLAAYCPLSLHPTAQSPPSLHPTAAHQRPTFGRYTKTPLGYTCPSGC